MRLNHKSLSIQEIIIIIYNKNTVIKRNNNKTINVVVIAVLQYWVGCRLAAAAAARLLIGVFVSIDNFTAGLVTLFPRHGTTINEYNTMS